ncbi:Cytochrome D1 heme domain protein [compost metagenome]
MEFTARGDQLWLSVRDGNEVQVWDPYRLQLLKRLPAESPSGIFFSSRAHETGL